MNRYDFILVNMCMLTVNCDSHRESDSVSEKLCVTNVR